MSNFQKCPGTFGVVLQPAVQSPSPPHAVPLPSWCETRDNGPARRGGRSVGFSPGVAVLEVQQNPFDELRFAPLMDSTFRINSASP